MAEQTRHRLAFDHYVRLGAGRSLEALHAALCDDPSLIGLRKAPTRGTIDAWSSRFHWQDRLQDLERQARVCDDDEALVASLKEMNARHGKEGVALQQAGSRGSRRSRPRRSPPPTRCARSSRAYGSSASRPVRRPSMSVRKGHNSMDTSASTDSAMRSSADWWTLQNSAQRELARRNPDSLLDWSLAHRFFQGRPMRLIPALRAIYDDRHPLVVIQKAAQVFASEYLVNTALWAADTGQGGRGNVLFVMPTQTQVNDFSQARIDRAIGDSAYLRERLMPVPPGRPGPVRQNLKKVGSGYLYLRGSDSRRQLTSVDADVVLLDEYDLMAEGVLPLAQKRLASSRLGWLRVASTPRLPEAGINGLFLASDQRYYLLRCPACRTEQRLTWDANVDPKRSKNYPISLRCPWKYGQFPHVRQRLPESVRPEIHRAVEVDPRDASWRCPAPGTATLTSMCCSIKCCQTRRKGIGGSFFADGCPGGHGSPCGLRNRPDREEPPIDSKN